MTVRVGKRVGNRVGNRIGKGVSEIVVPTLEYTTGLQLRYRADAENINFVSSKVANIWDLSPNLLDAKQDTASRRFGWLESHASWPVARPLFQLTGASVATWVDLPTLSGMSAADVFCIMRGSSTGTWYGAWGHFGLSTDPVLTPFSTGLNFCYDDCFSSTRYAGWGFPALPASVINPYVLNITSGPGTWVARHNKEERFNSATNAFGVRAVPVWGISGGYAWDGEYAELLIYDHVLSSANRDKVWDYVNKYYGITL